MAQQAMPVRDARLGKPLGAAPGAHAAHPWRGGFGERGCGETVQGAVLLLPGGEPESTRRPSSLTTAAAHPLARRLARAGRADGLVAHVLRYRCRGWNGAAAHPVQDAEWAAGEVVRRYGDVPVCLVGTDMGGRAALRAAGHPAVQCVLAIAPWLPDTAAGGTPDPVTQLVGRQVLLVHGTNDARTHPELSYRLAERAKKLNRDICRFEVHADGHGLHQHRSEVFALAADFVLGTLFGRGYSRPLTDALAAPPPLGLRMPLAAGFGTRLRH